MLEKNNKVKVEVYKYGEYNIWIEINNNGNVFAYLNQEGNGVIMDMFGETLSDNNHTFDDFIALVEDNLDEYIDIYVDTYVF